ncbi:MAG TPA: hypothetical protein VFE33_02680 [Thermoanaerobaculia bacterium]|nr:hypothetical protein [Thermoanaerobaculia bacterium]
MTHPLKPLRRTALRLGVLSAALLTLGAFPAAAQTSVSATAGSLGGGIELTQSFSPYLEGRLGLHAGSLSQTRKVADVTYEATAKARTGTAFLDWHPTAGGFRLSGGLVYNDSRVDGTGLAPPGGVFVIGGVPIPVSQLGHLEGRVDFNKAAPYLGLGWGGPLAARGHLSFSFDLGVFYQGAPKVTLTPVLAPGSPLNDPVARQLLNLAVIEEERRAEKDLENYKYYPVLQVGLAYRF